jgi:thioredoxin reductase
LESGTRDVAIVGGGAAGVNAALVLGRERRDVILVDAGTPRNAPAAHMQGFLSRDGMRPTALLQTGRLEIERYGVEIVEDRVVGAHPGITLRLAGGRTISTRQLLLATDELPDIPGVRERWRRDACTAPTVMAGSFATSARRSQHRLRLDRLRPSVRQCTCDLVFFTRPSDLRSRARNVVYA